MKKLTGFLIVFLISSAAVYAQCTVQASVISDTSVCGDCFHVTAFGKGQGDVVFSEDFNSGQPTGWAFTQQAMFSNPCSPQGVDGTTHIWMGNSSGVPRALETIGYDMSSAVAGVTVCFDMLFATQGQAAPCEGPDLPNEGVYVQYSTDGGANWVTIHYFDPNGGNDPLLTNWNNWCFQLPQDAISSNTKIRWFQDNDSGPNYDHWGIDNVIIYFNDPTYNITWEHDGYAYGEGSSGGQSPNVTCPKQDTTYYVTMTNGTHTCTDSVKIIIVEPALEVNAGPDQTICEGQCVQLQGTAKVIKRPAKVITFSDQLTQPIASVFGSTTEIDVNVQGLNTPTVLPGSITKVCILGLSFFGAIFIPPSQVSIGALELNLICPDGTKITLVPEGVTSSNDPFTGYTNTCFVPAGGANIANASVPYTGNYAPAQSLDNLAGCTANGVWTLEVKMTATAGFGQGFFNGWSITFDDPEISYPANLSWTPEEGLIGANTATPLACPTETQTYTLTATDTAGCVTLSDEVTVIVDPQHTSCCLMVIDEIAVSYPSCEGGDGAITINISQGTPPYRYSIDNGANFQASNQFIGLSPDTFEVVVLDSADCFVQRTVPLPCEVPKHLLIPTAFSPNGDGVNDIYYVFGSGIETLIFEVYNRWGQKVFETNDLKQGWDGTFNGKPVPVGAYAYRVLAIFDDGTDKKQSGNITVLR